MNKLLEFKTKIKHKQLKIAVIGLGYVGLPLALEFAKKGYPVAGIDVDKDRLRLLKHKKSYISDVPGQDLKKIFMRGNFAASGDFTILKDIDVVFVCVPTPLKRKFEPNISYIISAIKSIAVNLKQGSLVILESTTYPGTTDEIILPIFRKHGFNPPGGIYLCFSPERIDPGNKAFPLNKITKIVGGINRQSTELARIVYGIIIKKVIPVSSTRVAETTKLLENTFRLVNIGLIDEMAMMAHKMGVDIWEIIKAASSKPFGFMPFYPSAGVGGHCIPKDPLYLYWKAKRFGFSSRFIKLASGITSFMPAYIVKRMEEALAANNKSLAKSKILILGATYKKDIKDLRKSPALDIIDILQKKRVKVSYFDPIIPYLKFKHINLKSINFNRATLGKFDCAIIVTDHSNIDYRLLLKNSRLIFDTRNKYAKVKSKKIIRL
ncbi:MAG: nucleotide sugar dehydrogenase [Candidatus Omnitrophica bacterium]|nr:nucleotide sugar dehydrogenase [Candidatus Omnitrophota bacterium]